MHARWIDTEGKDPGNESFREHELDNPNTNQNIEISVLVSALEIIKKSIKDKTKRNEPSFGKFPANTKFRSNTPEVSEKNLEQVIISSKPFSTYKIFSNERGTRER